MATGESDAQQARGGHWKFMCLVSIGVFLAIAITGPFRGAPALIVALSVVGAALMAIFMWVLYYRPTRR